MRVRTTVMPQERVWWSPDITLRTVDGEIITDATYEASFDGCQTWLAATVVDGRPAWLIAGPDFPGDGDTSGGVDADHTLTVSVRPYVRVRDTPETVIADGGYITLHG